MASQPFPVDAIQPKSCRRISRLMDALNPNDIQSRLGTCALAQVMLERWVAAGGYLLDTGDVEGAREALKEADRWKELAELAECDPYLER